MGNMNGGDALMYDEEIKERHDIYITSLSIRPTNSSLRPFPCAKRGEDIFLSTGEWGEDIAYALLLAQLCIN
nr:hypothetical protein Iba_chr02bCG7410 [Ipomoea batatas]